MKRQAIKIFFAILWMVFTKVSSFAIDVSVKDFGAKGDGKTDDKSAIQAAIDAVNKAGGGIVRFPEGTYLVTAPNKGRNSQAQINAANGVTLEGEGMDKSIIKVADDQGAWIALIGGSNVKNFTVHNLGVDGNGATNKCVPDKPGGIGDNSAHILVRLPASSNVTFKRCHFFNHSGVWAIICSDGVTNLVIDSCVLDKIGGFTVDFDHSTIYTSGEGPVMISNNLFASKDGPGTPGARTAMEIHGSNQKVINNRIYGFRYGINVCTGRGSGPNGGPTVNQQYIGNTITGVGSCFIFWSMSPSGFDGLLFRDNTLVVDVQGWRRMYPGETRGMFQTSAARGSVKNLDILHNTLLYLGPEGYGRSNDLHSGMWLGADPGSKTVLPISNLTITDNTIINSTSAGIALTTTVDEVRIGGNKIINPGKAYNGLSEKYASGIYLAGTMKNVVCENNMLIDDQADNTMKTGIWEETTNQGGCIALNNTLVVKSGARVTLFRLNPEQSGKPWTMRKR